LLLILEERLMATVIERVDRLEEALENFITSVGIEFNKVYNSQLRTEAELRDFKEENRQQIREMNRQWGDLANKLGTLVEDLVYPSLPRILRETLKEEILDLGPRRKRRLADGRVKEFDAVAVTATSAHVDRFIEDIGAFREFFPEYQELPIVGILATLAVDDSVLNYAEKTGFLVLAVGDQLMEVKNRLGFAPKRW